MMRLIGIIALMLFITDSAWSFDFDRGAGVDIKAVIAEGNIELPSVSVKNDSDISANVSKEWTIMVFVNAKNNLESYGLSDVNEMEMVGSSDKINVVVEFGRIKGYSSADGDWTGCKRYYIKKDNDPNKITSPVIAETPKCDMGSWEYLSDFANWVKKNYPAKRYVLIVWNHGSGWNKGGDISELLIEKGISYDDETKNHITTPQLRMALERIGGVDILAMDACLMQMIEIAYEVKDYAKVVVASEETEPADGYTYNTWLEPLVKNPKADEKTLARYMVDSYTDHYQSVGQGATQSAIDVAKLSKLRQLIDDFVGSVISANDLANAKNARTNAQKFYYSSNKDLYHFVKLMVDTTQVNEVKVKGNELLNFMKSELIIHNRAYGSSYTNAYGLAVWIPTYYSTSYDELKWAADSKWDEFIKWIK
ncbi:MAG: clostripain-related cysteine peptidase [Elusimicrobiales bacterium]